MACRAAWAEWVVWAEWIIKKAYKFKNPAQAGFLLYDMSLTYNNTMTLIACIDHYGNKLKIPRDKFRFRASAYGVLRAGDMFLMAQEKWTKLWEFPGGGVHMAEKIEDGLIREFEEETGLTVTVGRMITFLEDFFYSKDRDEGWHSLRFVYEVTKKRGRVRAEGNNDDVSSAAYMSKKELTKENTKPAILSLLNMI